MWINEPRKLQFLVKLCTNRQIKKNTIGKHKRIPNSLLFSLFFFLSVCSVFLCCFFFFFQYTLYVLFVPFYLSLYLIINSHSQSYRVNVKNSFISFVRHVSMVWVCVRACLYVCVLYSTWHWHFTIIYYGDLFSCCYAWSWPHHC